MKYILTILLFWGLQASGQQLFHAHNRTQAPAVVYTPVSGYVARWKADAGLVTSGSSLTQWQDQSGNGYHLNQSTAGAQPTVSTYGGKAAISFDGTNDFLQATGLNLTQPFTVVVVERHDYIISGYDMIYSSAANFYYSLSGDATYIEAYAGGTHQNATWGTAAYGPWYLGVHRGEWNGASSAFYFNGDLVVSGPAGTQGIGDLYIGSWYNNTNFFTGVMHEIIIYNRLLTAEEITQNYTYFTNTWN